MDVVCYRAGPMPRSILIGIALAAVAAVIIVALLLSRPVQDCYYWHGQLLASNEAPAPTPSGLRDGGLYCVPVN